MKIQTKRKNCFRATPVGRSAYHEEKAKEHFLTHTPPEEINYCQNCTVPASKCKGKCNVKELASKNDRASIGG